MKAIVYDRCGPAAEVLTLTERADPKPGPNEVLVQIEASGINPHDTKKRSGWLKPSFPPEGIIPHSDGAGVVVAAGPGADPGLVGRRVFFGGAPQGHGTAAEFCAVPAAHVFDLPDHVPAAEGASLGVPAFTAWLCTLAHQPLVGQRILIHGGSGAVGRVCVEMAAWAGAEVIATAGDAARCRIPADRGAAHVLNYREDDLADRIMDLTDGQGVHHIIDVDFAANMACNIAVIRQNGRLSSYSSTSDRMPVFDYYGFALKGVAIDLVQGAALTPRSRQQAGTAIAALLRQHRLHTDVSDVLPLDRAAQAHEIVEHGHAAANVVLDLRARP